MRGDDANSVAASFSLEKKQSFTLFSSFDSNIFSNLCKGIVWRTSHLRVPIGEKNTGHSRNQSYTIPMIITGDEDGVDG